MALEVVVEEWRHQGDKRVKAKDDDASKGSMPLRRGSHASEYRHDPLFRGLVTPQPVLSVPLSGPLLASREFVGDSLLAQNRLNRVTPVALKFDFEVLHRSSGAATCLQELRERFDFCGRSGNVCDHRDHTPGGPFLEANTRTLRLPFHLRGERAPSPRRGGAGRIDQPGLFLAHAYVSWMTPSGPR